MGTACAYLMGRFFDNDEHDDRGASCVVGPVIIAASRLFSFVDPSSRASIKNFILTDGLLLATVRR